MAGLVMRDLQQTWTTYNMSQGCKILQDLVQPRNVCRFFDAEDGPSWPSSPAFFDLPTLGETDQTVGLTWSDSWWVKGLGCSSLCMQVEVFIF